MTSGKSGGGHDDRGFDILRGSPGQGDGQVPRATKGDAVSRSASERSPANPAPAPGTPASRTAAELAATLEAVAAGERRLEARLTEVTETLSTIRQFATELGELRRSVKQAAEYTGNVKAANEAHLEAAGAHIGGLKEGRADLDTVVAQLKIREDGLRKQLGALENGIAELRTLWKSGDEKVKKVISESHNLAEWYKHLAGESKTHRAAMAAVSTEMSTLSRALREAGAGLQESSTKNAEAQLNLSVKTLGNVEKFSRENDRFLERFAAAGEEVRGAVRREWAVVRRWVVPALSAALVLAAPSFAAMGALAQNQFHVFKQYDETNGWKQFVWDRHGPRVKDCLVQSERRGEPLLCEVRVDGRGIFPKPAGTLPPLPPPPAGG